MWCARQSQEFLYIIPIKAHLSSHYPCSLSLPLFPQVADETGEVQYATHLVTVTEKDSKALGQPVGSTTTVLLTAYPGGHSGGVESGTESSEQLIAPPTTSATVPNVQVCIYNSHILCIHTESTVESGHHWD